MYHMINNGLCNSYNLIPWDLANTNNLTNVISTAMKMKLRTRVLHVRVLMDKQINWSIAGLALT